jgi:hypothetical protein
MEFSIKNILGVIASLIFLGYVLYLIRKGKLKEEYSYLWVAVCILMIVVSIFPIILIFFRNIFGFSFIENVLYFFSLLFLLLFSIQMTVLVSRLSNENKVLAQKIAILEEKLEQFSNKEKAK